MYMFCELSQGTLHVELLPGSQVWVQFGNVHDGLGD